MAEEVQEGDVPTLLPGRGSGTHDPDVQRREHTTQNFSQPAEVSGLAGGGCRRRRTRRGQPRHVHSHELVAQVFGSCYASVLTGGTHGASPAREGPH